MKKILIMLSLISSLIFLINNVNAISYNTTFLNYSDATHKAYENLNLPSSPSDYDAEALSGDYTNLETDNAARWATSLASNDEDYDSQIFHFKVDISPGMMKNFTIKWNGYGDDNSDYITNLSIYNWTSTSWEELNSTDFTSEADGNFINIITSSFTDYINTTSNLTAFLVASKHQAAGGLKDDGETCSLGTECSSDNCVDGYCCDTTCASSCQACNVTASLGTCTDAPVDTDYHDDCAVENCNKGTCDGSGACDYYTTGEGACATCSTCESASSTSCVTITDNLQDTEGSNVCEGTCEACQSGSCSDADVDTDPGDDCAQGSNETHGCSGNVCDGSGSCDVQESGDGGCPLCGTCSDSDIACEYHPDTITDTGCAACSKCSGSEMNACTGSASNTNWGADLYNCVGTDKRCYSGTCHDCSDNSGYLYSDGCSGCAGQGGSACWKHAKGSCNSVCSGSGGCVAANWNDNSACTVQKHFYSCQCSSGPSAMAYAPTHYSTCYYRDTGTSQSCSAYISVNWWRACVCQY
jgi:hypothetical protein